MQEASNPRRPARGAYSPKSETPSLLKVSGNPINGLGEAVSRRPSPFFWHPPEQHPYGELQNVARQSSRKCPGSAQAFMAAYDYPELVPIAETRNESPASHLSAKARSFALSHEADSFGIAAMNLEYVFEGYTIDEPWVVVLALAHDYDRLKEVPSDETNGVGVCDVGDQYARGTRASYALANWIRAQGYGARPYPGPGASALLLIPPAIAAGLGELGKHGSLISRESDPVSVSPLSLQICRWLPVRRIVSARMNSAPHARSAGKHAPRTPLPITNRWSGARSGGT